MAGVMPLIASSFSCDGGAFRFLNLPGILVIAVRPDEPERGARGRGDHQSQRHD